MTDDAAVPRRALAALAFCLLLPDALRAQDDAPELLTAIPETPALAFLDATAARVLRPGSVRDFALALLSGTGESGTAQHGFAVETTPWFLVPGVAIDGRRYMESRLAFLLANLQLSIEEKQELLEIFDPADRLNRVREPYNVNRLGQVAAGGVQVRRFQLERPESREKVRGRIDAAGRPVKRAKRPAASSGSATATSRSSSSPAGRTSG